jgi:hypothetical protein
VNAARTLKILVAALCAAAGSGSMPAGAFAAVQDSRFEFTADGADVDFDVRNVPRRDVLDRLFADTGIEIKWLSSSFAAEPISGQFNGAPSSVVRQLLAKTNFVIAYDDESRVSRVIIVGPATGEQASAGVAAIAAAVQRHVRQAAPPKAQAPTAVAQNSAASAPGRSTPARTDSPPLAMITEGGTATGTAPAVALPTRSGNPAIPTPTAMAALEIPVPASPGEPAIAPVPTAEGAIARPAPLGATGN